MRGRLHEQCPASATEAVLTNCLAPPLPAAQLPPAEGHAQRTRRVHGQEPQGPCIWRAAHKGCLRGRTLRHHRSSLQGVQRTLPGGRVSVAICCFAICRWRCSRPCAVLSATSPCLPHRYAAAKKLPDEARKEIRDWDARVAKALWDTLLRVCPWLNEYT